MSKQLISFNEFIDVSSKLEIRTGKVISIEEVEKSAKLLKLVVEFGENDARVVVTNIKPYFRNIEDVHSKMKDNSFLFVTNLEPVKMMGIESNAMILPGELEKNMMVSVSTMSLGSEEQKITSNKML